ncbi:MAG: Superfamily I DNA/RNA helicase, partial [Chlorobi bacterium OLB7]
NARRIGSTTKLSPNRVAMTWIVAMISRKCRRRFAWGAWWCIRSLGGGKLMLVVGSGDRTKLTVRFDSVGQKQLMLKFSHLRVL